MANSKFIKAFQYFLFGFGLQLALYKLIKIKHTQTINSKKVVRVSYKLGV